MTRLWLPAVLHRALLIAAAAVLLMRHGHKGASGENYNLSPQGFQRALDLASVTPACFGSPSRITTYFLDPDTSKNARSYQTAVPLAVASGVNIRIYTSSVHESRAVGQRILGDAAIQGGLMVIFWEHRRLPDLAAGLGWPSMPPIADNDFNKLHQQIYSPDSSVPTVLRYSQSGLVDGFQPCTMPMLTAPAP